MSNEILIIAEGDLSTSVIVDDGSDAALILAMPSDMGLIVLDRIDAEIGIVEIESGILAIPQPKYTHLQTVPSATWNVNHNLGFRPIVQVYTLGGMVVTCDVLHNSVTQATLSFSVPISGFAQFN